MKEDFTGETAPAEMTETAKMREAIHEEAEEEVRERLRANPFPSDTEVLIGAYLEQLEPQVRDAIVAFYKKGYQTESSGFYKVDEREVQAIDGFFSIDEETEKKLAALGVKVSRDVWADDQVRTKIYFEPEGPDVEKIKAKWAEVVEALPDLKKVVYSDGGSEYWLDRTDIQKAFIERRYKMGLYKPEEKELIERRLKELSE